MKLFIVLSVFAATASASLIAIGYNARGLDVGSFLVSGVRAISPIGVSYVSPIVTGHVSSLSARIVPTIGYGAGIVYGTQHVAGLGQLQHGGAGFVSSIGYGTQHIAGIGLLQQGGVRFLSSVPVATTLVPSSVIASVRTITPVINSVHLSSLATRITGLNVNSAPLVSNIGATNLYSTHGSGLHASGHLGKKL